VTWERYLSIPNPIFRSRETISWPDRKAVATQLFVWSRLSRPLLLALVLPLILAGAALHNSLTNKGFVSGHRFSDAARNSQIARPFRGWT
jgi:hypothetical protein